MLGLQLFTILDDKNIHHIAMYQNRLEFYSNSLQPGVCLLSLIANSYYEPDEGGKNMVYNMVSGKQTVKEWVRPRVGLWLCLLFVFLSLQGTWKYSQVL